jgi:NitT/TauT family transport system ATP-binding protein
MTAQASTADLKERVERPVLRCQQITKRFSTGTLALSKVDLTVTRHEFLSLLGPSGCGKSTMLRMIAGLTEPTAGAIDWPVSQYDYAGRPERNLSFVFQEPTLMPWATALGNAMLPLSLAHVGKREARERALAALRLVGLDDFRDAYPRELSGGMKMRVSIARALVTRPSVLLLDEPFAALDEITRFKLNNDLLQLWADGDFTVIFVTHSVFESVYLSQRVVVMAARPGRIMDDIAIEAPYPRGPEFRLSPGYSDYCRRVTHALERTMMQGGLE